MLLETTTSTKKKTDKIMVQTGNKTESLTRKKKEMKYGYI
jgi:hypothetical protein